MSGYGDKPFGLRDVKLTNMAGTTQVDLPASQKLSVTPKIESGELHGDDVLTGVVSIVSHFEWELEAGGISLEAVALMTGTTATASGTSPSETTTVNFDAGDALPYFKIYGRSLGEGSDDIHVKLYKCKLTELEGEFSDGEFYVTSCKGLAISDGSNGIVDYVQNETAADLPAS